MKWRGGGFDNLRKYGKEIGQTARRKNTAMRSVGYRAELFEKCVKPGCGLTRLDHERGPLFPDHQFRATQPVGTAKPESEKDGEL